MNTKKRKSEISYMNIIFCMSVIMIHVLSEAVSRLPKDAVSYNVIYVIWRMMSTAVPGFIFLSGLKLSMREIRDYKEFYLKRATAVLIPYLCWMPVYYLVSWKLNYYPSVGIKDFFIRLVDGTSTAHFYFIVAILQFYILMPLWQIAVKKIHPVIVIALCAVINGWSQAWLPVWAENNGWHMFLTNDRLFTNYILAWICGCYVGKSYDKAIAAIKRHEIIIYLAFIALTIADQAFVHYVNITGEIYLELYYVNMLYCLSAIFALAAISVRIAKKHPVKGFIATLDKSCYYIYLSHLMVLMLMKYYLDIFFPETGVLKRTAICFAAIYAVSVVLSMVYVKAKSRRK